MAEALHPGSGDARGYILGLNGAAIRCLLSSGPALPNVLADIRATGGLAAVGANADGFATYEDTAPDALAGAVEALVIARTSGARDD